MSRYICVFNLFKIIFNLIKLCGELIDKSDQCVMC